MDNHKKLRELIQEYQAQVQLAVRAFKKYLDFDPEHEIWWEKGLDEEGDFGPSNQYHYFFHGTACNVQMGKVILDWDYGYYGRCDGFNSYALAQLAETMKGYEEFKNPDILKVYLEELKGEGLLDSLHFHDQYFLIGT